MRCVRRRLFAMACALSLAVCMGVMWEWRQPPLLGGVRRVIVTIPLPSVELELSDIGDALLIGVLPKDHREIEGRTPPGATSQRRFWGVAGVAAMISVRIWNGEKAVGVMAQDWFLVSITAVLPLIWFVKWAVSVARMWRRARRGRMGLCLGCAYDLRGSPERCPECGIKVAIPL